MIGKIIKGRETIGIVTTLGINKHVITYAVYQNELKNVVRYPFNCHVYVKDIQEPTKDEINLYKKYLVKFGYIYSSGSVIKDEEF